MCNRIDSLTDGASQNPNVATIAELCVNRTEACAAGLSGYIHTAVFPNCDFGVWDFSLCGYAPKYRIHISGIQPLSERIRVYVDTLVPKSFICCHVSRFD